MKYLKFDPSLLGSRPFFARINTDRFRDPAGAFGRWVMLIEVIVKDMDKTERCHANYTLMDWAKLLRTDTKTVSSFFDEISGFCGVGVSKADDWCQIDLPILLNCKDKYSAMCPHDEKSVSTLENGEKMEDFDTESSVTKVYRDNSKIWSEKEKEKIRKKKKISEAYSPNFELTNDLISWAKEKGFGGLNLQGETECFLDWAQAHGRKYRDWKAGWRNWIRNTKKYGANVPTKPNGGVIN